MDQYSARARPSSRASALVGPEHPASKLPRRRLAILRPGMIVEGVLTRMVRGGALADIQLESNEPAFVPLREIPARAMPLVRSLIESQAMHKFRIVQLDRGQGTATVSLEGLIIVPEEPRPETAPRVPSLRPAVSPVVEKKPTAGERARLAQQELLQRMRETGPSTE